MEKKNLKLEEIQIKSFVTSLDENEKETIVAGAEAAAGSWLLSSCVTSLRCPIPDPDLRDEIPVRTMSPKTSIMPNIAELSRKYAENGLECPFHTYKPEEK